MYVYIQVRHLSKSNLNSYSYLTSMVVLLALMKRIIRRRIRENINSKAMHKNSF